VAEQGPVLTIRLPLVTPRHGVHYRQGCMLDLLDYMLGSSASNWGSSASRLDLSDCIRRSVSVGS